MTALRIAASMPVHVVPSCGASANRSISGALGWTNGFGDSPYAPKGELVATGDPSVAAGVSLTYPHASDFSDAYRYTFFAPWGRWDADTVIGGISTTSRIGPSCAAAGRAFETLLGHGAIQRIPLDGPVEMPIETVDRTMLSGNLHARFLTRLPAGFLLGLYSQSFRPQPPQQPLIAGTFERVIEVDDDGKAVGPANRVVGCHGISPGPFD